MPLRQMEDRVINVEYPHAGTRMCDICLIATDHPGMTFRRQGRRFLCRECIDHLQSPPDPEDLRRQWQHVMKTLRGAREYDFLLAYSGGVDSTAALKILVERYGLKILAFTVDNGMKHEPVWRNAMAVTQHLGVNWLYINDVKRASEVILRGLRAGDDACCSNCNRGWRFPNYRETMATFDASCVLTGLEIPHGGSIISQNIPWLVKMMAAHMMPKNEILDFISDLPWKDPGIVQGFDSDCLGGGFGLELYRERHRRHAPIVISFLSERIRYGLLDRDEELAKLNTPVEEDHWEYLERRFGPIRADAPSLPQETPRLGQR